MPNIKTIRSNIVMTKALWSIVVSFTSGTNAIGQTTTEKPARVGRAGTVLVLLPVQIRTDPT